MKYNNFPQTGLKVSSISLGTMMFGGQTSEADSLPIMDYAYDHGINFFDTSNNYNDGESERIVGKGLQGRRDKLVLATKVRNQTGDVPPSAGLSRHMIINAIEHSLRRLNTDYIDIYYMHAPDYATSLEETMQTMDTLVKSGKIRYIGVSNFAAWQIADIVAICDKRNCVAPIVTQNGYNMITRGVETELVPFVRGHKLGLTVYNPIAAGLLAGKHKPGVPLENTRFANNKAYFERYWSDQNFVLVEELTALAQNNGMSILELAMKWCDAQPCVTSIISGVSRLSQLEQNIAVLEGKPISAELLKQADEIYLSHSGSRYQYNR